MEKTLNAMSVGRVAVVTMTGTCCPVTLAHIQAFVEARRLLLSRDYQAVLGALSLNGDGYVTKKLSEKGLPSISMKDRRYLVQVATEEHEWLVYNSMSNHKNEDAICKFYQSRWPHLHFDHYLLNGADDVIRRKKWTWKNVRQIVMCRPGVTEELMTLLQNAGIDAASNNFIVGPELPDISSTEVRNVLVKGDKHRLLELVHPSVGQWCWERGPYRPPNNVKWQMESKLDMVNISQIEPQAPCRSSTIVESTPAVDLDCIQRLCSIGPAGDQSVRQSKAVASSGAKGKRAQIAMETLDILANGGYTAPDSCEPVNISRSLCQAVAASTHFPASAWQPPVTKAAQQRIDIEVRCCTTLAAAQDLASSDSASNATGVLNFASARNPGGGFTTGAEAQEESLARSSGIYPCLSKHFDNFFEPNRRAQSGLYTHDLIYSPGVPVLRDDFGNLLNEPYHVDFVTAAAPNCGVLADRIGAQKARLQSRDALDERIMRVLKTFASHGCVDIILGAWGCGVFRNDPTDVAELFKSNLAKFNCFRRVIFAVLDPGMAQIFADVFQRVVASGGVEESFYAKGKGKSVKGKDEWKGKGRGQADSCAHHDDKAGAIMIEASSSTEMPANETTSNGKSESKGKGTRGADRRWGRR